MEGTKIEDNNHSLRNLGYVALVAVSLVVGGRIGGAIGYDMGYEKGFCTAKDTCYNIIRPFGAEISDKIRDVQIYHPKQQEFSFHLEK